mmetsp:Transcript_30806/g.88508  ORF Transcript_30806/g.88508 Transcript_30806/m.88508 type:complete len:257 (+) Transcript_30806:110-880(+)|eukprot:CAMPEP_0177186712 /NCGR_PEP_ID=MMETSP0367-20130122/18798_1 /TAXON_ID=447022 ORGANISM="Scrippsiella hangoei-like, Strain SHHI-4" /NCGR_SAMPLE_ID=MMETSP0367 /ASSEMBLY_ACC=CAM_ASM_000362 /LENGTH=256 /DNA_ID=CAMNT_0018634035 /DNA_START=105 /DNA_END=875 /DNA_ORIENTATION=+
MAAPACARGMQRQMRRSLCAALLALLLVARASAQDAAVTAAATEAAAAVPCTTDTTTTTTTVDISANLAAIQARFEQMDAFVEALRTRLTQLTDGVVQVQSLANITGEGLNKSETDLMSVQAAVQLNANAAAALKAQFEASAAVLRLAQDKTRSMQGVVMSLERSALEMGSASSGLGKKIGQLEAVMKEVMPGQASIGTRVERATTIVEDYTKAADAGTLDPLVAGKLRESFLRARARTKALAEDALRNRMEESVI